MRESPGIWSRPTQPMLTREGTRQARPPAVVHSVTATLVVVGVRGQRPRLGLQCARATPDGRSPAG